MNVVKNNIIKKTSVVVAGIGLMFTAAMCAVPMAHADTQTGTANLSFAPGNFGILKAPNFDFGSTPVSISGGTFTDLSTKAGKSNPLTVQDLRGTFTGYNVTANMTDLKGTVGSLTKSLNGATITFDKQGIVPDSTVYSNTEVSKTVTLTPGVAQKILVAPAATEFGNFNGGTINQEYGAKTGEVAPVVTLNVPKDTLVLGTTYKGIITYTLNDGAANTADSL